MAEDYAGDVSARQAWQILEEDPSAVLVDVRDDPEWRYVGLPDLSQLGRETVRVSWQFYPQMRPNPEFVGDVRHKGVAPERTVLLICRSGVRSRDAAIALTASGFRRCYNVAGGFEGPPDAERHRGTVDGWKAAGLPWRQD